MLYIPVYARALKFVSTTTNPLSRVARGERDELSWDEDSLAPERGRERERERGERGREGERGGREREGEREREREGGERGRERERGREMERERGGERERESCHINLEPLPFACASQILCVDIEVDLVLNQTQVLASCSVTVRSNQAPWQQEVELKGNTLGFPLSHLIIISKLVSEAVLCVCVCVCV